MKRTPAWYAEHQARVRKWQDAKAPQFSNEIASITDAAPAIAQRASKAASVPDRAPADKTAAASQSGLAATPLKFRNVKTDGYASKKEAARASQLRLMQEAGQIRNLCEQMQYELIPRQEGERACFYRADFVYEEFGADGWRKVVEDTKGVRTADYVIKRKLMLHVHSIRIRET